MATNKVQELQKQILALTDAINKNGKATKEQAAQLKKLEKQYQQLGNKLMPQYRKAHEQVNESLRNANKVTNSLNNTNKGFFARLKTATGTLLRYSIAYKAINAAAQLFNELVFESAKRAIRLEKALADVAAIANLSGEEVSRLKDVVFEVAGVTSLTATEVVALQKQLAKLGTSVSDIEKLTGPVAILSQALGEEPGGVASALKKALNQFQATTEEADRFAGVLVGAVNETALSLNDLGTALQYVGPLAAQSGVSFEETASLLGILADNGFRASRAGTGLRNVLLEAAKSGKPFSEFLQELSERNLDVAKATELFGKRGASAAIVLANNADKVSELSDELSRSDRLFLANAKQMANVQGQLDILRSAYDKASTSLGEYITKTDAFLSLIAVFDREAAGTASAYRVIADSNEKTTQAVDKLVQSQREFVEGANPVISKAELVSQAFDAIKNTVDISKDDFLKRFNKELEKTGNIQAALTNISGTWNNELNEAALTIKALIELTGERSDILDNLYISQEANNKVVKDFNREYTELQELTRTGIEVEKEKAILQSDIEKEIARLKKETFEATKKGDFEQLRIINKRIALLQDLKDKTGELAVDEDTLADRRKKRDKEDQERLKTQLSDYIARIKETEKAISELPEGVSDQVFAQQIDLLSGFFGGADEIIAEATKRFGADSEFVKELIKIFKKASDEVSVQLPKEVAPEIVEPVKTLAEKIRDGFKELNLAEIIADGLDKAAESIENFNETAFENTKNRLEAEKSAIENRFQTETDILKSQLDNQLITESQFRAKQKEIQKARLAEENSIDRKIFEANKKQDRQDATTDYLQSLASIIPTLVAYDKTADPIAVLIKAAVTGALVTGAYGAELAAINQRRFFPKKFAEGGMVNGPSHDQGGVPFSVQGRGGYEMEGGEYIINKRATAMHKDLLDRINASGMTRPKVGNLKFAQGGMVNAPVNESVDYLKAIAEATTSTAIGVSKPVRAYVSSKDLRQNETERRLRDRNDRI